MGNDVGDEPNQPPRVRRIGPREAKRVRVIRSVTDRFGLGLGLALAMWSLLWALLFLGQLGKPVPQGRWIAEALAIKQARLAAVASPKVVILAGSNAWFGLDSGLLEEAWGAPTVNLAVNAALGLRYILASAEPDLEPGDLVLMPLEYPLYAGERVPNQQLVDHVLAFDPDYWRGLPLLEQLRWMAGGSAARLVAGWRAQADLTPAGSGRYGGARVDARGDYRDSALAQLPETERAEVHRDWLLARDKQHRYGAEFDASAPGWRWLQAFAARLRARGVCLVAIPPTLMAQPSYREDAQEFAYYSALPQRVRALGIAFVGEPYAFMYPPEAFFDTPYHLHAEARSEHTAAVIALLGADPWRWCATGDEARSRR